MCNTLKVKDYSVQLENLSTDKLKKLLHIAVDSIFEQEQILAETRVYAETLRIILSQRGE